MTNSSSITVTTRTLDIAELGPDSPLPSVQPLLESPYIVGGDIAPEIADGARYGHVKNMFPYPMQESYGRELSPKELTAVVLENQHIKATFLPQLGGRLWSLEDKASGKELLHTQDRIQFANLALRNAWFAGGIEYNIGTRGHSPTTCAPLHSAIVRTPDGTEILRMWEFDRLREVVFQIDAWLPTDSKVVFVGVRIQNPNDHTVPMYWWTNAAIPQTPATRVLAPAVKAYATDYDGSMTKVVPSDFHGTDATWPLNNQQAADFFFDIAPAERRWEVAMDDAGDGLAMISSAQLRGRKLFVWGETVGGHRWQEWLSPVAAGEAPRYYAEIQSGLALTQFEHVPMPAGAAWQWVEAYGNAALEPAVGAGEWDTAVAHGAERVQDLVSETAIDAALLDAARWADLAPVEMLVAGHGWGALERARRQRSGRTWIDETGTPFATETLTGEQLPWLALLEGSAFAGADSFVRGADWEALLTRAGNAEAALHFAVMTHARTQGTEELGLVADRYSAVLAQDSLATSSRALAHRGLGLALLSADASGASSAAGLAELAAACALEPANRWLLTEAMSQAIANNAPSQALALVGRAPEFLAGIGRVKFLTALAHSRAGSSEIAAQMLREGLEVADLREGEDSLTALWREVCPGEDVPREYQFSMK